MVHVIVVPRERRICCTMDIKGVLDLYYRRQFYVYIPRGNTLLQLEAIIQPVRLYYGEPFVSKWRYKIPCVGFPKIDSICFINSILSGRDRLDVLYQLDFIDFIW